MELIKQLLEGVDDIAQSQGEKILAAYDNDQGAKQGVPREAKPIVEYFARFVPRKALQWVINQYKRGEVKIEDAQDIGQTLTKFQQVRPHLQKKDLNQYKSLDELYDAIESLSSEQNVSNRQKAKDAKHEGAKKLIDSPNFKVLIMNTPEAACYYAKGTKWCTSDADTFKHYQEQGPLYVIMAGDRKFQMHVESEQAMNERDRPMTKDDIKFLSQYEEYTQFLNYLIDKHYGKYLNESFVMSFKEFLIG